MVCSACGFENGPNMRFCGMCGTPLPHRPLTTPGAQSTLNLTRVPVEAGTATHEGSSPTTTVTREAGSDNGRASITADAAAVSSATPVPNTPPKELVPDVPLDQYLQNFRYEPPSDPEEVTMRGEAAPSPEIESPAPPQPVAPRVPPQQIESPRAVVELPAAEREIVIEHPKTPVEAVRPAVPEDTVRRLGIEPEAPEEQRIQRPRYLDINEPSKAEAPSNGSGTSTIVGPSFLGLSDAPQIAVESAMPYVDEEEGKSHWRGWVALAILLIFAVLGVVQWRAQTGSSPLKAIKTKLYSLRHGNAPPASSQTKTTDPIAADTIPKPDTQTAPQASTSGTTSADSSSQVANPTATTSATPQQTAAAPMPTPTAQASAPPAPTPSQAASVKPQSPPTIDNSLSPTPTEKGPTKTSTPTTAAAKPDATLSKRQAADSTAPARSKQAAPGADEMAKAKDASDSAAAAAWLWKATAKGNPEAPVQLADLYIKGDGVPKSCEQALVLLKTAAAKENALARNRLASMYAAGNCVQRNRVEAYRWMSSALVANPDSQWAQQNRDTLWNQMTPAEQAAAQKYR